MSRKITTVRLLVFYYLPSVLWALLIFHASSYPTAVVSHTYWQEFTVKKMAHVFVYSVFTVLNYRAFLKSGVSRKSAGVFAVLVTLFYGFSDEYHQEFTPKREPTIRDALIDTAAGAATIYAIWNLLPKMPKKLTSWVEKLELL